MEATTARVVRQDEVDELDLGGLHVRFLVEGERTGGDYALVECPLAPRALGAEPHTHTREDEVSYVLQGEVGVQLDGREEIVRPGDAVVMPRGVPHAFWNAGDTPARVLMLIRPAGFEGFLRAIAPLAARGWDDPEVLEELAALAERYGLSFTEGGLEDLVARHGLVL